MADVYKRIDNLLKERGISGAKMSSDLGMSRSFMTELRKGRAKSIKIDTAQKIAAYFDVPVGYILGESLENEETPPTLNARDERDIAKNLESLMAQLDSGDDLMFDGDPMSDEARESIRAAMKLGLEAAKLKNKERFTPNKFKKG